MKRFLVSTLLFLSVLHASAQNAVRATITITPPYSTKWVDYRPSPGNPGKLIITLQNLTNAEQRVYVRAGIRGVDNGVRVFTQPDYVPATPIVLAPMQTRPLFTEEVMEIYDPNRLVYVGTDQREIRSKARVPEGLYSVCARVYDHTPGRTTIPLSAEEPSGCTTIFMQDTEAPMLIQPLADAEVNAMDPQNVIFSWTQPAGTPPDTRYRLRIVEMFHTAGGQTDPNVAYEASRSPVFDQEVMGTVYVYGPADHALVKGRSYAWAVTAVDPSEQISYQNRGRSEVRKFVYREREIIPLVAPIRTVVQDKGKEDSPDTRKTLPGLVSFVPDLEIRSLVRNRFKGKLTWAYRKSETGLAWDVSDVIARSMPIEVLAPVAAGLGGANPFSHLEGAASGQQSDARLYVHGGGATAARYVDTELPANTFIIRNEYEAHRARILSLAADTRYPLTGSRVSLYLRKQTSIAERSASSEPSSRPREILLGSTRSDEFGEFSLDYHDAIPEGYSAFLRIGNAYFEFAEYDIPVAQGRSGTYDFGELTGLAKTYRLKLKIVNKEGVELDSTIRVRIERPKGFYTQYDFHGNLVHEVMKDSLPGKAEEVVAEGKAGAYWKRLFYGNGMSDTYTVVIEGGEIKKTNYQVNLVDIFRYGPQYAALDKVVVLEKTLVADMPLPVVEGRVLTRIGQVPAGGATVTVRKKGSKAGSTTVSANGHRLVYFDGSSRSATTDSTGKFRIANIPVTSEPYEVAVNFKGRETIYEKDLYLSQDGIKETIDPLLIDAELLTVVGKVVDINGEPLPDATLTWKSGGKAVYSDEAGNFLAAQTEGTHTLVSRKPGYKDTEYTFEVRAGDGGRQAVLSSGVHETGITSWNTSIGQALQSFSGTGTHQERLVVPKQAGSEGVIYRSVSTSVSGAVQAAQAANFYEVFSDGMPSGIVSSGHVIVMSRFFVKAIVKDKSDGQPIKDARISAEGSGNFFLTDDSGTAIVEDIPGGNAALIVSGPENAFYERARSEILVDASKDTLMVEVLLKAGASASGQVSAGGAPLANAEIAVEGLEYIRTLTDAEGRYTLTGIPVGEYTLLAGKEGLLADRKMQDFQPRENYTINFSLTDPGFNAARLLGFTLVLHTSAPGPGANEFIVSGELRGVPDNPIFKIDEPAGFRVKFTDKTIIKDGNTIYPKDNELVTDVSELRLKAFDYLAVKLRNPVGLRIRAIPGSNKMQGEFIGEGVIDLGGTFSSLSGIALPAALLTIRSGNGTVIAPINSTGTFSQASLGLAGSAEGWKIYGVRLVPDLAGSNVDRNGFNLKGKIRIEGVPALSNQELKLDRLTIGKRGDIGEVVVNLNPKPVLTLVAWKLMLSGVQLNQYGLRLAGELNIPVPSSAQAKIGVRQLAINGGVLSGGTFSLPAAGIDVFGLVKFKTSPGRDFTLQRMAATHHYRFIGAGTIDLPKWFDQRIPLDNFSIATNREFSVIAKTDVEVDFAGMANLGITRLGFASNTSAITVGGKFRLNIPMFGAGADGTIHFRRGHAPRVDELGINFSLASAIALEASVKFSETKFRGKGGLKLAGMTGVGLDFWYENGRSGPRVGAQFLANVAIPIGLVKLDRLTGGFDFDFTENIYSINAGGRITIAPDPGGIVALDPIAVKITSAPGGPVFEGGATVKVMSAWSVGNATMKLDFNKKQFYIDGEFGTGFNVIKGINVESRSGVHLELYTGAGSNYWFVAGYSKTSILGIFDSNVDIAAGWNVPRSTHHSLSNIPGYVLTDGRLYGGYFGVASDIGFNVSAEFLGLAKASLWYKNTGLCEVYANFKSSAFGFEVGSNWQAGGSLEVWGIGTIASADVRLSGGIKGHYRTNSWGVGGNISGSVRGHIGCEGGCNRPAWKFPLPVPCGLKICAGASATVSYTSNDGLDVDVKLFD